MIKFFQAGGFGMWMVLLLGIAMLVASTMFLIKPEEKNLRWIQAIHIAMLYAILTAVSSDLATTFYFGPNMQPNANSVGLMRLILTGIGESLTPAILGSAMLTIAWCMKAVGLRKLTR
jgi:hypothetical protein